MELPSTLILSTVSEGNIFFFKKGCIVGIPEHRHICVKKSEDEVLIFTCCTSQEDTMNRLIQYHQLDPVTIPWIKADETNKLTKDDSFVNCNNVYKISYSEFCDLVNKGIISSTGGTLKDGHFSQIVEGILASKLVEEEIKDYVRTMTENTISSPSIIRYTETID